MAGPTLAVPGTGPTYRPPTSTKALRERVEKGENNVKRLQANRKQPTTLVHQLGNAAPMAKVADGQTLRYNATTGQYEPADIDASYASLTGSGEHDSPGDLTQDGGFTVEDTLAHGILLRSRGSAGTAALVVSDTGAVVTSGVSVATDDITLSVHNGDVEMSLSQSGSVTSYTVEVGDMNLELNSTGSGFGFSVNTPQGAIIEVHFGGVTSTLGFFGTTPVIQQGHPSTLAQVITVLENYGLVSP